MNESAVVFIAIIVSVLLLLIMQIYLSFRKSKWFGIIPALLVIIFAVAFTVHASWEISSYTEEKLAYNTENGYKMSMVIRYDREGKVIDFSDISISDQEGRLLDSVSLDFDDNGNIIENDYSRLYIKDASALIGDRTLYGSPTYESNAMVQMEDGGYYSPYAFLIIGIFPFVALLVIHLVIRYVIEKKRRKKELDKINIGSL